MRSKYFEIQNTFASWLVDDTSDCYVLSKSFQYFADCTFLAEQTLGTTFGYDGILWSGYACFSFEQWILEEVEIGTVHRQYVQVVRYFLYFEVNICQ